MAVCDYNCTALEAHEELACRDFSFGGISAFAVLDCDHTILDFTDAAQWNAAIAADEAFVIKQVRGGIADGSEVTSDSVVGCRDEDLDGYDMIFNFVDGQVTADNDTWAASLSGRNTLAVFYLCSEQEILVVDVQSGQWMVKPASVPESRREKQTMTGQFKWFFNVEETWTRVAAPSGIFS